MHKSKSLWFIVGAWWGLMLLSWTVSPTRAHAQPGHIEGVRFDGHLGVGWHGFGPGLRLDIALVPDGFISSIDDEFAITFGVDFLFRSHYGSHRYRRYDYDRRYYYYDDHHDELMFVMPVAAQWNFILPHNWTIFPELGFALVHHYSHVHPSPHVAFGARWHFTGDRVALLLRLAHPGAFQVGITY